jgi:hypothetical protein
MVLRKRGGKVKIQSSEQLEPAVYLEELEDASGEEDVQPQNSNPKERDGTGIVGDAPVGSTDSEKELENTEWKTVSGQGYTNKPMGRYKPETGKMVCLNTALVNYLKVLQDTVDNEELEETVEVQPAMNKFRGQAERRVQKYK